MAINFTNINLVWTSILAETLYRLGLRIAVVSPGSRSAPLTIAFANHPHIQTIPVLDERSAAFFALGVARRTQRPVVLVCTSGTAGANFYPAIIEAKESGIPLLVLTADRPPELHNCRAGQAINQQWLYGTFPNWQTELALPSLEPSLLAYLRQTLIQAWTQALEPVPGPVHLNQPLRDPLAPTPQPQAQSLALRFDTKAFFANVTPLPLPDSGPAVSPQTIAQWQASPNGIIIVGAAQPEAPIAFCHAIAHLSQALGYPVLADGLSPLRNAADSNPHLIATYDLILRNPTLATKLAPDTVIQIGELPTSKQLRTWLAATQPDRWIVDPTGRNLDPLHGPTNHLRTTIAALAGAICAKPAATHPYLDDWRTAEAQVQAALTQTMQDTEMLFEGKVAWLLSRVLPRGTPLFISSSMPVRDVEFFWTPGHSHVQPYFNRGANGIDGSLSTAIGVAHQQQSSVMLTGDLALLHDTNGFLLRPHFEGHLTIVLINNNGGGIFEMLPIAQFDPPFESFFATPQSIDFAKLCATYDVAYERITNWDQLAQRLNPLPTSGIRVLEVPTDRKADAHWRQTHLNSLAAQVSLSAPPTPFVAHSQ